MIDPREHTVTDWCTLMILPLSPFVTAPTLLDERDWKRWAYGVIASPQISVFSPPDPRHFDNWLDWAIRFNQAVPT